MISIAVVKPGAVLARPVVTPKGVLMAPEGIELTEMHLATFMTSGIVEIDIIGNDVRPQRHVPQVKIEEIRRILDKRFALMEDTNNQLMRDLRAVTEEVLVDRVRTQDDASEQLRGH